MRQYVDRHLGGESFQILDVDGHVLVRREAVGQRPIPEVKQAAARQKYTVQRADPVRQTRQQLGGELAPEVVVPAELGTTSDRVLLQRLYVGMSGFDGLDAVGYIV